LKRDQNGEQNGTGKKGQPEKVSRYGLCATTGTTSTKLQKPFTNTKTVHHQRCFEMRHNRASPLMVAAHQGAKNSGLHFRMLQSLIVYVGTK
jgi:hypothetical protein